MSLYTVQDWRDYLIVRNIKDDPALPKGKLIDFKPKMIELDRNIGHKSVMSISEFFIDRDEPSDLVDQAIHDMEVIGDAAGTRRKTALKMKYGYNYVAIMNSSWHLHHPTYVIL